MTDNKDEIIKAKDNEINNLKNQLDSKEKEKNELNNQITSKNNDLEAKMKEKDNKINELEKKLEQINTQMKEKDQLINQNKSDSETEISKRDNQITELNNLIKEKVNSENSKSNEIINLKNDIKQKEEKIKTLSEEINKLKNENENKNKELSTKESLINELETKIKNNVELKKANEEKKAISLELERIKKMVIPDLNGKRLYDISLNFNSIKSIKEGLTLKFSELGLNYFNSSIKCRKIGVIGNKHVGKSFILSYLFGLPYSLTPFHTKEKISIKFKLKKSKKKDKKDNKNIEFIVIDTDGFNLPILEERNVKEELELAKVDSNINNIEEKKGENDKENNNNNNKINIIKGQKNNDTPLGDSEEISENLSKSCFDLNDAFIKKTNNIEELKINKILTEDFITRFIIDCSDILIMVVGLLKYSEQKLLNKVMEQCVKQKKDSLYVIHNLQSLTKKEQVDDYIKEVLMNSGLTYEFEEIKESYYMNGQNNNETIKRDNIICVELTKNGFDISQLENNIVQNFYSICNSYTKLYICERSKEPNKFKLEDNYICPEQNYITKLVIYCMFNVFVNLIVGFFPWKSEYNKYKILILNYEPRRNMAKTNRFSSTINSSKIQKDNNFEEDFEHSPTEIIIVYGNNNINLNNNIHGDNLKDINNEINNSNKNIKKINFSKMVEVPEQNNIKNKTEIKITKNINIINFINLIYQYH